MISVGVARELEASIGWNGKAFETSCLISGGIFIRRTIQQSIGVDQLIRVKSDGATELRIGNLKKRKDQLGIYSASTSYYYRTTLKYWYDYLSLQ